MLSIFTFVNCSETCNSMWLRFDHEKGNNEKNLLGTVKHFLLDNVKNYWTFNFHGNDKLSCFIFNLPKQQRWWYFYIFPQTRSQKIRIVGKMPSFISQIFLHWKILAKLLLSLKTSALKTRKSFAFFLFSCAQNKEVSLKLSRALNLFCFLF